MKKFKLLKKGLLICTTFTTISFASCGNDESIVCNNDGEIRFSTSVSSAKSGSINVQIPKDQNIGISITEDVATPTTVYNKNLLYAADGTGNLTGESQRFPTNGNSVRISAYHPYSTSTTDNYVFSVQQNQIADADTYTSDLLFCSEFVQAPTTAQIALSFKHKLSLITYNLTAGDGNPDLTNAQVSAVNVATSIAFDRKTGEVGSPSNITNVSFGSQGGIVVPQNISAGTRLLTIRLASGKEVYYTTSSALNLESGKKYTFNLRVNLTGEATLNTATVVEDWAVGSEIIGEVGEGGNLRTDMQLGAFFFGAWHTGSYHIEGQALKSYPERQSIWGWDNCKSDENISAQIDVAKNAGLTFFAFDWYIGIGDKANPDENPHNAALDRFKRVNKGRMKYCLLAVNEPPGSNNYSYTPEVWERAKKIWINELRNNNNDYLKIDGKPALILFDAPALLKTLGGWDGKDESREAAIVKVRNHVSKLKTDLNNNVTLVMANSDIGLSERLGFDIITNYSNHVLGYRNVLGNGFEAIVDAYTTPPLWDREIQYNADRTQITNFKTAKDKYPEAVGNMRIIPTASLNWDQRSVRWGNYDRRRYHPYYAPFTEDVVYTSVSNMVNWLNSASDADTPRDKIGFIYAWNEYNEGAWLTPSANNFNPANGIKRALTVR